MNKFPCSLCEKLVAINHEPGCCDVCNRWVHIRCNNICKKTWDLIKDPTPWFCKSCIQKEIPFSNINDTEYTHLTKDLKSDSHLPKIFCFISFTESLLKIMKNTFYFILKALFLLKIFKFLSWLFGHVWKTAWLEK